ncbi:SRPBCC family protein [Phenylobacterium immobile]|uniref:SRPBCC family protein n=1 Tax=Phenylobacterium immobile TaxID=21 RepID=UPI000A80EA73|nr:SRPBCC family protein [Phenylobacterium immobile]
MAYYDTVAAELSPEVYSDPGLLGRELDGPFARSWLFGGPASWVEQPGAFYVTRVGRKAVVLWRDSAGVLGAYENRCARSEESIVAEPRGSAEELICGCHGWAYTRDGAKGSVPLKSMGAAVVDRGFVFVGRGSRTFREQLGEFAWYFDLIADSFAGGVVFHGELPLKTRLTCNWKLGVETYCGDQYRRLTVTKATTDALDKGEPNLTEGFQAAAGGGVVMLSAEYAETEVKALSATIFPNLSFDGDIGVLHVWHPVSANETEVHTYCLVAANDPQSVRDAKRRRCSLHFGPTGMETQDHEAVWSQITKISRGRRRRRAGLNLQMGLGHERRSNYPGQISDLVSEMGQRSFYAWWQAEIDAPVDPAVHEDKLQLMIRKPSAEEGAPLSSQQNQN